jgi:Carboxypeptidase regulatory-like domain
MLRTGLASVMLAASIGACGGGDELTGPMSTPPPVPMLAPGMAMLRGEVSNVEGGPIAGARLTMLSTAIGKDVSTTTGADGRWSLTVPGDTAVTLRVEAMGYAPTRAPTVMVGKNKVSEDMELFMLPAARIDQLNAMGGSRAAEYAVIGVDVRAGACDPEDGQISLSPVPTAKVIYNQANSATPDPSLTAVQAGARPAAWIVGILPPGTYYQLHFSKPFCTQKQMPMEWEGRSYTGQLPLETKAFSHGMLFVD